MSYHQGITWPWLLGLYYDSLKNIMKISKQKEEKEIKQKIDKLCMKIKYEDFESQKDKIYELIGEGFRFAIVIDNSFIPDYKNIQCLQLFKYIILNRQLDCYEEFIKNKLDLKNIIEI